MQLDEKDSELLGLLSKNGKASQRELARETGVALGTVNTHLRKLENERVINNKRKNLDFISLILFFLHILFVICILYAKEL